MLSGIFLKKMSPFTSLDRAGEFWNRSQSGRRPHRAYIHFKRKRKLARV